MPHVADFRVSEYLLKREELLNGEGCHEALEARLDARVVVEGSAPQIFSAEETIAAVGVGGARGVLSHTVVDRRTLALPDLFVSR